MTWPSSSRWTPPRHPSPWTPTSTETPRAGQAAVRYNWLGAKQRSTETLTGLTLMGVRLYNPTTGRFLSMDPVHGGGDNRYGYPGDPVNQYDLDGKRWRWGWKKRSYRSYGYSYRSRYASYRCGAGVRFCAPRNAARNRKRNWAFTKRRVRGSSSGGLEAEALGWLLAQQVAALSLAPSQEESDAQPAQ
ncbi:hypothetical protein LUX03_04625 [Streptomyces sudanensis]|nr:RHS repeat-associated core domain-containing protein [Streptomyces sudanensis]MCP9956881.1 hypothetical protein [Streptomyces sudanensis]